MKNNNLIEKDTFLLETVSISEDTLKHLLKQYRNYSRDQLLSALRLVLPKQSRLHSLFQSNDYVNHYTDQDLRNTLKQTIQQRLNRLRKYKQTLESKQSKKDHLHMKKSIDRNQFPIGHPLRNTRIPLPLRKAPWWIYGIVNNHNTRNAFNQIKDLIALSFIEHNRINIVRMDFYLPEEDKEDLDRVTEYFNHLLSNTLYRTDYYLDYICSKEYTKDCGVHLHCLFLLDGNKIKNEVEFITTVGRDWDRIVGKEHSWYSANLHKGKYPDLSPCLGVIRYDEFFKIERLVHCCKYLIKSLNDREWLVKLGLNPRSRLFTMSFTSDRLYQIDENNKRFRAEIGNNRKYLCCYDWIYSIKLNTAHSVFSPSFTPKEAGITNLIDLADYLKENKSFNGKERDLVLVEENGLYYSR